jgi:hypothetical protein
MPLNFVNGAASNPKGHALVFFEDSASGVYYASYVVLLPITVDVSKYVPPFLMNQVGELGAGDMNAFAFPPAPEPVTDLEYLLQLSDQRSDDLIDAGTIRPSDVTDSMMKVNEIVEEYLQIYEDVFGTFSSDQSEIEESSSESNNTTGVNDVLYSLMGDSDRLSELTKLVGKLRYSIQTEEEGLISEAREEIKVLSTFLPDSFEIDKLIQAAVGSNDGSETLTDLYLKRCFHLHREEYAELAAIETEIAAIVR